MTFKHTSLVLFAAFAALLSANTTFANSVSQIPADQMQDNSLIINSSGNFTVLTYVSFDDPIHGASTASQTVSLYFEGMPRSTFDAAMTLDPNAANTSSVYDSSRVSSPLDTNRSEAQETAFHYPVAEPGTLTLFGTGLVFLAGVIRRKFAKA